MKSISALTGALALGLFGCAQNNSGDVSGSVSHTTPEPTDQNTAPSQGELQSISYMSTDVAGYSHLNEAKSCGDFKLALRYNHLHYPMPTDPAAQKSRAQFLSDAAIEAIQDSDQVIFFEGKIIQYRETEQFAIWNIETPGGHPLQVVVLQSVGNYLAEQSHLNPSNPWFKAFAQPGRALCGVGEMITPQPFGQPLAIHSEVLMDRDN